MHDMKHIYIETLGCSKNLTDSEYMLGLLDDTGAFELVETPEEAEVLVVNTCSFIHDAKTESIETILAYAEFKVTGRCELLIVAGCLSQRYSEELLHEMPEIDALVGTTGFHRIVEVVEALYSGSAQRLFLPPVDIQIPDNLPRILTTPAHYAYLKISEGCDNRCTYCVIPKLRGAYRSRYVEDIVDEARDLAALGVKELIVIAQDTSRYGIDLYGRPMLPALLEALAGIESVKWIRVHYAYPDILDETLLDGFFAHPRIVPYFDIPIQHGADSVLKRMNRRTTNADIRRVVHYIRSRSPQAVIRTTVIVGFPGETEAEFQELMALVSELRFDRLGAFRYSDEEDTAAMRLPNKCEEAVIEERYGRLMTLQMGISEALSYDKIGRIYDVIVEEEAEPGRIFVGRTAYDSPEIDGVVYIHTPTPIPLGTFIQVKITDALEYDVIGEPI